MIINKVDYKIYLSLMIASIIIGIIYIILSLYNEKKLNKKLIIFFILLFIMSITCAKLFSCIFDGFNFKDAPLASYGGLVGVLLSALIYEKIYPNNGIIIKYSTISLPIIYSFGKIACFIRGCCFGIKYNGPLHVIYSNGLNIKVFPVQLLEVIIFFILFLYSNTNKNRKDISYITILLISIFKFLIEFLRYDFHFFNSNQLFSILLFIITLFFYKIKKH